MAEAESTANSLLLLGALASSASNRLFYQAALSATDNGFVSVFFLVVAAASALASWLLSNEIGGPSVASTP